VSLERWTTAIPSLDESAMARARERQDRLTKPQGSLGRLEDLAIHLAGITGASNPRLDHKLVIIMAADHGVVVEGVSAYPQEVTSQMVANFINGGAAINVLSRLVGARVVVVDMGVAGDLQPAPGLLIKKIGSGSGNMARGPAMSREQARKSVIVGAQVVEDELQNGLDILATGEMGIGNTTPSAAIAALITEHPVHEIVGRGTGLDESGLARKVAVVETALRVNNPDPNDGLDVLSKVGGFEIGGLAGAMLAAAAHRKPVLVDGFIASAAAMLAVKLAPRVRDYLIASHRSKETGHGIMLDWLGLVPLLDLDLRLGEGSGAALGMWLVEASSRLMNEMATFGEAGVSTRTG